MTTLRHLLERRTALAADMRSLHDSAGDADLTPEQRSRWDAMRTEHDALADRIERQSIVDETERRSAGVPVHGSGDDRFDSLLAEVRATDAIRAQLGDTSVAAGRAREASAELARRSGRTPQGLFWHAGAGTGRAETRYITTGASPQFGPAVQTTVSPNVIDRLRDALVVRKAGATVLAGLTGNLQVPKLLASASAAWVAEGGSLVASDPQMGAVTLTPRHTGAVTEISRQLLQQSSPDVAALIESDLAKLLAAAIDRAALKGGGTSEPVGILATSGIPTVALGSTGAAATWGKLNELVSTVDAANGLDDAGRVAFVGNAVGRAHLRTTIRTSVDTASTMLMGDPNTLLGYPFYSSQAVPSNLTKSTGTGLSGLIFGNWQDVLIGYWSELDLLVSPHVEPAFSRGGVMVRAMATCDVALRHKESFACFVDLKTS